MLSSPQKSSLRKPNVFFWEEERLHFLYPSYGKSDYSIKTFYVSEFSETEDAVVMAFLINLMLGQ